MRDAPPVALGSVALGAVDVFHLKGHAEMRSLGHAGNVCAVVAELGGRLEVARLERRLCEAAAAVPELRWRLGRDRWLRPVWRNGGAGGGRLATRVLTAEARVADEVTRLLRQPLDGREPWRLDLLQGQERDHLVLRWFHPYSDARGAARLLGWLGSERPPPPAAARWASADRLLPAGLGERRAAAQRYFRHTMALARRPVMSLYGAAAGVAVGQTRFVRLRFGEHASRELYRSLRERARLADSSVFFWAGARLLDAALGARGFAPVQYLAPVPVSLDKKGDDARMFGNHLTMMMLALDRDELADEARAVRSLARQRREIVRERIDEAMVAGLHLAGVMPAPLYNWAARRPFAGERGSLVVSNPGELGLSRLFGHDVIDAYSVPAVLVPPGLQLIASRHRGVLSLTVVFTDGLVADAELAALLPALERDVLGTQPAIRHAERAAP